MIVVIMARWPGWRDPRHKGLEHQACRHGPVTIRCHVLSPCPSDVQATLAIPIFGGVAFLGGHSGTYAS